MVFLLGFPLLVLGTFWMLVFRDDNNSNNQATSHYHKRRLAIIYQNVPLWSLVLLHVYRLDGLSLFWPFWNGRLLFSLGVQIMIVLDVWMDITAVGWTFFLWRQRVDVLALHNHHHRHGRRRLGAIHKKNPKHSWWLFNNNDWSDWFLVWNSLGWYELLSGYGILLCNYVGLGGPWVTAPPLAVVGFHPLPIVVLFQAPLAMGIHKILLSRHHLNQIIESQSQSIILPLQIQRPHDQQQQKQ